ncbi:MAG: hypothetical protein ACLUEQ_01975 [Cloacibacillus evryensis]
MLRYRPSRRPRFDDDDGATAAVMDNDVTDVLEEQLNSISGISSLAPPAIRGRR